MEPIETIRISAGKDQFYLHNQPNNDDKYTILMTRERVSHIVGEYETFNEAVDAVLTGRVDQAWDWTVSAQEDNVIDGADAIKEHIESGSVKFGSPVNVTFGSDPNGFTNTYSDTHLMKNQHGDIGFKTEQGNPVYLYYSQTNFFHPSVLRISYIDGGDQRLDTVFEDSEIDSLEIYSSGLMKHVNSGRIKYGSRVELKTTKSDDFGVLKRDSRGGVIFVSENDAEELTLMTSTGSTLHSFISFTYLDRD